MGSWLIDSETAPASGVSEPALPHPLPVPQVFCDNDCTGGKLRGQAVTTK